MTRPLQLPDIFLSDPGPAPVQMPAHERVYQRLRAQILFGEMAPGQAVTIQGLAGALDAGMTPVREAIRRLISEGALMFQGNRRVSVPILDASSIEQITFLRKTVEYELTYRAAKQIDRPTIKQLEQIDAALDSAISSGDVGDYLRQNYQFHKLLYEQARASVLAGIADRLWLQFGPSLRVVCGRFGTQSLPDRHKDLLEAVRDGQAEAAGRAIVLDLEQGMDQIAAALTRAD
ncbi:GntR family transcriptional regulator [Rhodobacteraceae bacterium F11138]|nr:GntR family transcriptional regulator [Rhodobacteraceae bacterium F11138]